MSEEFTEKRIRIVYVEDDKDIRYPISQILTLLGYDVISTNNGQQGVAAAERWNPDIILMDFDLPDINGRSLILVLSKQLPDTAIIAVTAHVGMVEEKIAKRFGSQNIAGLFFKPQFLNIGEVP